MHESDLNWNSHPATEGSRNAFLVMLGERVRTLRSPAEA
jgi:hypothetical protein